MMERDEEGEKNGEGDNKTKRESVRVSMKRGWVNMKNINEIMSGMPERKG